MSFLARCASRSSNRALPRGLAASSSSSSSSLISPSSSSTAIVSSPSRAMSFLLPEPERGVPATKAEVGPNGETYALNGRRTYPSDPIYPNAPPGWPETLDTNHDPRSRNFAHMIGFLASFWVGYGFYKEVLHLNGIRFHWEEEH